MKLDKHVVDMFTELTKPADDVKMEKTCYGTISVVDGTRYVKLDGSDLLVPAASTVKTSHGDRVTVLMKNHSLTVTGNLTAPATDGEGGSSGEAGTAATIEIGTVTTGEAGSSASVTNSGTTSAAVFDFVIPKGDKGEKGDTGPQGPQGEKGDTGTWDGTIPDHEHTVSDITDLPIVSFNNDNITGTALEAKHGDILVRMQIQTDVDMARLFKSTDGGNTWNELPLGNADTVDGLHAASFLQNLGFWSTGSIKDLLLSATSGTVFIDNTVSGMPVDNAYWFGFIDRKATHIIARVVSINNKARYSITYNGGLQTWYGWVNETDGGNAATLDGKHASDFVQKSGDSMSGNLRMETNQLWFGTGGITQFCFEDTNGVLNLKNHDGTTIFAADYHRSYATNADTVDDKHAESFMQWLGHIGDVNFLNDANYKVDYHCNISDGTVIGLPIAGWYHIVYYMHSYNGHGMQIAYPLSFDGATMIRRASGTTWGTWKNIADGGTSSVTNHQRSHYLGDGTDILTYAASDDCPCNVNTKVRIMHSPTCPTNYGYDAANNDFWYDIYKIDNNSWVQIKAYDVRGNAEFINSRINGTWSGWARCNDGGTAVIANYAGSVSSTSSNICLRNLSSGTAAATTDNCPVGTWYGQHS